MQIVNINLLKENPENPRIISEENFNKLVTSIKEFPEMLNIRPIVVNRDNVILGGNMRLRACKAAGLKEVPVIHADILTEEEQKEFILRDNVSTGTWDIKNLREYWDIEKLKNWGINLTLENPRSVGLRELPVSYSILVTCTSEREQKKIFDNLKLRGFSCKLIG